MGDGTTNKRVRNESEDSEVNFPESKRIRVDSYNSVLNSFESNRAQEHSDESIVNSAEFNHFQDESDDAAVNSIRDDLLDILDDSDTVSAIQDLDSVIKSFEEEILDHPPPENSEMTSGSGKSQPELGFLLEASDDELGLPPSLSSSAGEDDYRDRAVDLVRLSSDAVAYGDMMSGFDGELPSYNSYGFGLGGGEPENDFGNSGEFVTVGGLFDYEPEDYWEFSYKAGSLPAL